MTMARPWRVAGSLDRLLEQVNEIAPRRRKAADGAIGDAAHAASTSDHNPYVIDSNGFGVVRARDFTHDPAGGFDSYQFARSLAKSGDKRIRYLISNGEIWNPDVSPAWRRYTGKNPHDHHAHVSVEERPQSLYDSPAEWKFDAGKVAAGPALGDRPPVFLPSDPVLKRGAKGETVKHLQTLLNVKADGDFGPATERAVKAFQTARNLDADGIVGVYTWLALRAAPKVANLERPTLTAALPVPFSTFDRVMEYVFADEGGLTISADEPGGASNMGISVQTLAAYLGRASSISELTNWLTSTRAKQIYRARYWDPIGGDALPAGLNYAAFDMAVNSGLSTVDRIGVDDYLGRALTEATIGAQIDKLCDLRLERMRLSPNWEKYKRGWTARVARVRARSHAMAA
jgi:lysozyme family protein